MGPKYRFSRVPSFRITKGVALETTALAPSRPLTPGAEPVCLSLATWVGTFRSSRVYLLALASASGTSRFSLRTAKPRPV